MNSHSNGANAHSKGTALELIVSAIETLILSTTLKIQDNGVVRIDNRKIISVAGVRHEADIQVTVDLAEGYKSVFIFECKNWKEKVGKNEIIIFSEKIKVFNAQHGFFIAKSFTSDATEQAKLDQKIELVIAKENDPASTILPFGFQYTFQKPTNVIVKLIKNLHASNAEPFDITGKEVVLNGETVDFLKFLDSWVTSEINESMKAFPSGSLADGDYQRSCIARREFDAGQFTVDGADFQVIDLKIDFDIHLKRPSVLANFDISGRGQGITFEQYEFNGVKLTESVVAFRRVQSG
jgi:Restriction endonuclease